MTDCIEGDCVHRCVDRAWFCRRCMDHFCFLCLVMSHFVTLSIIEIEVSPFTLALISHILIYIQAASLLSADDRVGVGIPTFPWSLQGLAFFQHERSMLYFFIIYFDKPTVCGYPWNLASKQKLATGMD